LFEHPCRHPFGQRGVASPLEEKPLALLIDRRIQRVEPLFEPEGVELLAPHLDRLGNGRPHATAFVPQQGEQALGGAAQLEGGCGRTRPR
jgi:hypothetical protein